MSDLACQFMDVMYIPNELDEILRKKSHGIASWCEQLIKSMLTSDVIEIVSETQAFPKKESGLDKPSFDSPTTSLVSLKRKEHFDVNRPRTPFYSYDGHLRADSSELRRKSFAVSRGMAQTSTGDTFGQDSTGTPVFSLKERRRSTGSAKNIHFNLGNLDSKTMLQEPEGNSSRSFRRSSILPEDELIQEGPTFNLDPANFVHALENSMPFDTKKVCIISPGVDIFKVVVPESVKDMVLARVDRMLPLEQVTLKCASILGTEFHRNVLQAILPKSKRGSFDLVLYNLAKESILECASLAAQHQNAHNHHGFYDFSDPSHAQQHAHHHHHHHHHNVASSIHASVYCGCYAEEMIKVINLSRLMTPNGPKKNCLHLKFMNTSVQETLYSLWLEDQRKELHEKAAMFLESQAHKCTSCGGGGFVASQADTITQESQRAQGSKRASGMFQLKNLGANGEQGFLAVHLKPSKPERTNNSYHVLIRFVTQLQFQILHISWSFVC